MRILSSLFLLLLISAFAPGCSTTASRATVGAQAAATSQAKADGHEISTLSPEAQQILREAGIEPSSIRCNSLVIWDHRLDEYARAISEKIARAWHPAPLKHEVTQEQLERGADIALGYLVRSSYDQLKPENVGVMVLRDRRYHDAEGHEKPLLIFRSGITIDSANEDSCLRSLIAQGHVKHVINLYGGDYPFEDLIATESKVAKDLGATYFDGGNSPTWRRMVKKKEDYERNRKRAELAVAELINTQILRPHGKEPEGNIYFHCGGGMHRTGMVYGIIQRCMNGASTQAIEEVNKRHTAYRSPEDQGGFEPVNLRFIEDFDCGLLKPL